MGAQDERETWVELPFWRLIKYYALCLATGFIFGASFILAGLHLPVIAFYMHHWWTIPSTLGVIAVIAYLARPKKNKKRMVGGGNH